MSDPLKEVTRKERRSLLGVSVAALIIAKTGILPSRIESIGMEFATADKPVLFVIFAFVVFYYLLAFVVYAASDFIAWQRSYDELVEKIEFDKAKQQYEAEQAGAIHEVIGIEPVDRHKETWRSILRRAITPTSVIRALVEFLLPIGVGLFAFTSLLLAAAR